MLVLANVFKVQILKLSCLVKVMNRRNNHYCCSIAEQTFICFPVYDKWKFGGALFRKICFETVLVLQDREPRAYAEIWCRCLEAAEQTNGISSV
jgi:hypothetical protein